MQSNNSNVIKNTTEQQNELAQIYDAERENLLQYACYYTGNRAEAEDAIQNAAESILQQTNPINNMKGYLYRAVSNACMDIVRRRKKRRFVSLEVLQFWKTDTDEDFQEEYKRINRLMKLIPEDQSEIIRMRFYANKSFAEIATILEIPLPTVKSRFLYGMDKIRKTFTTKMQ